VTSHYDESINKKRLAGFCKRGRGTLFKICRLLLLEVSKNNGVILCENELAQKAFDNHRSGKNPLQQVT
jgi:hypothetical protein